MGDRCCRFDWRQDIECELVAQREGIRLDGCHGRMDQIGAGWYLEKWGCWWWIRGGGHEFDGVHNCFLKRHFAIRCKDALPEFLVKVPWGEVEGASVVDLLRAYWSFSS